jgi:peptidoglycan hydrolase CwlO-like protein
MNWKGKVVAGVAGVIGVLAGVWTVVHYSHKAQASFVDDFMSTGPTANPTTSGAGASAAAAAVAASIAEKQGLLAERTASFNTIDEQIASFTTQISDAASQVKADESAVTPLQAQLVAATQTVNNLNLTISRSTDTDQWVRNHLADWFAKYYGTNPKYYGWTEWDIFYSKDGGPGGELARAQGSLGSASNAVQVVQNSLNAPLAKLTSDQGTLTALTNQKSSLVTLRAALQDTINQIQTDIKALQATGI